MKKIIRTVIVFAFSAIVISSCKDDNESLNQVNHHEKNHANARISEQLDSTILIANQNPALDLKLISYSFRENDKSYSPSGVKEEILSPASIIPIYEDVEEGDNFRTAPTFRLGTISEASALSKSDQGTLSNARENLGIYLDKVLEKGQNVVQLNWESKNRKFSSVCVFNEAGLVYDNVLSNLFTIDRREEQLPANKSNARVAVNAYTATVVDLIIKWAWGSKRGEVFISHTILVDRKGIKSNSGNGSAWMSVGSGDTRQKSYKRTTSWAQLTYAYAWATPTASFSFSSSGKPAKFSVSMSGIGSKGKGSGIHTYYLR